MKLIIRIILIGALTYFLSPYFTWWLGMLASFLVCFMLPSSGLNAFIAGFLGMGLIWLGQSWNLDVQNESAFSSKIADILLVGEPLYLVLISGLVGAISGGFSAVTGASFRQLFVKKKKQSFYS
ncbi:MAG: hypothetical protein AAF616_01735 [Bacteroidota bacterium]